MNKILLSIEIDGQQIIENVIVTAIEGGSNYWIWFNIDENWFREMNHFCQKTESKNFKLPFSIKIVNALMGLENFKIPIYDLENTDELLGELSKESFIRGCELCAKNYPKHWANILSENFDADDADIVFQLAVMGDVVFG